MEDNQTTEIAELIKPQFMKAFTVTFISFMIPALILIGGLFIVNLFVDLAILGEIFALLKITFDASNFFIVISLIALIVVFIVSIINTIIPLLSRIEVYKEKIIFKKSFSVIEVPFDNIVKMNFELKGMAKQFHYGTLIAEASGIQAGTIKIEYIHDVQNVVMELQNRLVKYRYDKQDKVRVQHIMEGF